MKKNSTSRVGYYLFGVGFLIMLSAIILAIILLLDRSNFFESFFGNSNEENALHQESLFPGSSDIGKGEMKLFTEPDSGMHEQESQMQYMGPNAPLFTKGDISPTGQFLDQNGEIFAAGIIYFSGKYPQDFAQKNLGAEREVNVTLAFGWNGLPKFNQIETQSNKSTMSINLPKLSIISLEIQVEGSTIPDSTDKQIQATIETYIYELFEENLISSDILHIAQQRLASAYIQIDYNQVELIPFSNDSY